MLPIFDDKYAKTLKIKYAENPFASFAKFADTEKDTPILLRIYGNLLSSWQPQGINGKFVVHLWQFMLNWWFFVIFAAK